MAEAAISHLLGLGRSPIDVQAAARIGLSGTIAPDEGGLDPAQAARLRFWLAFAVRAQFGRLVGVRSSPCKCPKDLLTASKGLSQLTRPHPGCDFVRPLQGELSSMFNSHEECEAPAYQAALARLEQSGALGEQLSWLQMIKRPAAKEVCATAQARANPDTPSNDEKATVKSGPLALSVQPVRDLHDLALRYTRCRGHAASPTDRQPEAKRDDDVKGADEIPSLHDLLADAVSAMNLANSEMVAAANAVALPRKDSAVKSFGDSVAIPAYADTLSAVRKTAEVHA